MNKTFGGTIYVRRGEDARLVFSDSDLPSLIVHTYRNIDGRDCVDITAASADDGKAPTKSWELSPDGAVARFATDSPAEICIRRRQEKDIRATSAPLPDVAKEPGVMDVTVGEIFSIPEGATRIRWCPPKGYRWDRSEAGEFPTLIRDEGDVSSAGEASPPRPGRPSWGRGRNVHV